MYACRLFVVLGGVGVADTGEHICYGIGDLHNCYPPYRSYGFEPVEVWGYPGNARPAGMATPPSSRDFPNLFTKLLTSLPCGHRGSRPCRPAHGSRYGKRRSCAGRHADLAAVIAAGRELGLSLLLQDHRLLRHVFFLLNQAVKGAPSWVSSSLASSSVVAVVQTQMSIPRILSTLSYSISGKISCSFRPKA